MTGYDLQRALDALGLSQRKGAKFLGVGERTMRRWIADASRIPRGTARLLRTMVKFGIPPADVPAA